MAAGKVEQTVALKVEMKVGYLAVYSAEQKVASKADWMGIQRVEWWVLQTVVNLVASMECW